VKRKSSALESTAYHEAGHAVIAHFQHVKLKYVTIVPGKDSLGHVQRRSVIFGRHGVFDDSIKGIDRGERHIRVSFAGQIAQRKIAPRSRWRVSGRADHQIAMDIFWHICSHDEKARNLYLSLLWRQTECLVDQWWKVIKAVAQSLLERKSLTDEQLRAVIDEALGLKPFARRPGFP
jgi:hypothetical protein